MRIASVFGLSARLTADESANVVLDMDKGERRVGLRRLEVAYGLRRGDRPALRCHRGRDDPNARNGNQRHGRQRPGDCLRHDPGQPRAGVDQGAGHRGRGHRPGSQIRLTTQRRMIRCRPRTASSPRTLPCSSRIVTLRGSATSGLTSTSDPHPTRLISRRLDRPTNGRRSGWVK